MLGLNSIHVNKRGLMSLILVRYQSVLLIFTDTGTNIYMCVCVCVCVRVCVLWVDENKVFWQNNTFLTTSSIPHESCTQIASCFIWSYFKMVDGFTHTLQCQYGIISLHSVWMSQCMIAPVHDCPSGSETMLWPMDNYRQPPGTLA